MTAPAAASADLLTQLRQLTGDPSLDEQMGQFFLEMCEGNVDQAAAFYREQNPAPAPAPPPKPLTMASRQTSTATTTSASRMSVSMGSTTSHSGLSGSSGLGSGSRATSRRRTSTISTIPNNINTNVRRVEPGMGSSSSRGHEPGGGLVTGRRNRGFANNVDLLGAAAEFEFLGVSASSGLSANNNGNAYTSPAAPNKTMNMDVYGFSSPGAFNEYQDGEEGMYARERRESAVNNSNLNGARRSSAMCPSIQPLASSGQLRRAVTNDGTGNRYNHATAITGTSNRSLNRTTEGSLHRQRRERSPTGGHSPTGSRSNSPPPPAFGLLSADPRRRAHSPTGGGRSQSPPPSSHRMSTVSTLTDFKDSMVSSSRLYDDANTCDMESFAMDTQHNLKKPPPTTLTSAMLQRQEPSALQDGTDHWTGMSLYANSRHRMSTASSISAFSEMGISQSSLMTTEDNAFGDGIMDYDQPKKRDPNDDMELDMNDLSNDDIIGTSHNSNNGMTASSSRRRVSVRNYAVEPSFKPVTKHDEEAEMLRTAQRIAMEESMSSLGDESDPTTLTTSLRRNSSQGSNGNGPRDSQTTTGRRISAVQPTIAEESSAAFLDGSASSVASSSKPDPPGGTINTPWLYDEQQPKKSTSNDDDDDDKDQDNAKKPAAKPCGKDSKVRRAPATRPGAVSVGATTEEPGKVKRAPATQPGAVSVSAGPSEPQNGKVKRSQATTTSVRPGAISVVGVQEPGQTVRQQQQQREPSMSPVASPRNNVTTTTSDSSLPPPPPLLQQKQQQHGKARRTVAATKPGAVSVSADEPHEPDNNNNQLHDSSSNNNMDDSASSLNNSNGGKGRRTAPATRPGAVSVSNTVEPSSGKAKDGLRRKLTNESINSNKKHTRRAPATTPGAVSVPAVEEPAGGTHEEPQQSSEPPSGKVRNGPASTRPGAVSVSGAGEEQAAKTVEKPGLRNPNRDTTTPKPGAVSVKGDEAAETRQQESAKEGKATGLRRSGTRPRPGAVCVSGGTTEQDDAEQRKHGNIRLGQPKPGVVHVSGTSTDGSTEKSQKESKKMERNRNRNPRQPGAVTVTTSEDDSSTKKESSPTSSDMEEEPAMDPRPSDACSINVDLDHDDDDGVVDIDDPTLAMEEQMHRALQAARPEPRLPFPAARPTAHDVVNNRNRSPVRVVSHPVPKAAIPTPANRRRSDMPATGKKGKKGRLFGLFKRKEKQPVKQEDMDFAEEDNMILSRTGTSRAYQGRMPTHR